MFISSAFAQAAPAAATGGDMQSSLMSMLPLVLMFVVLYFVMIRPQMKKQKEQKKLIESIGKGDKIVTLGGIQAKIIEVAESSFLIESEGTKLRINKSAISMEATQALTAPKKEEAKK